MMRAWLALAIVAGMAGAAAANERDTTSAPVVRRPRPTATAPT